MALGLAEGAHLVDAALSNRVVLESFVVSESGARVPEHIALMNRVASERVVVVSDHLFKKVSSLETPAGILALFKVPESQPFEVDADCLLLYEVQDDGNLGTLLRTAAASSVRQVALSRGCCSPWSAKSLRAGMGAQFQLNITEGADLKSLLTSFGGTSISTDAGATQAVFDANLRSPPVAWLFGNEGRGLPEELKRLTTSGVSIPMPGGMESLNVGAAAAICLFEMVRQRRMGSD